MRWVAGVLAACALCACDDGPARPRAQTKEALGALLFEDPQLSEPAGQACADCHVASAAFADPEDDRTSAGVIRERFGIRNTPSAMYLRDAPPLHAEGDKMVGGLFWDGRAHGFDDQVGGPLLNPLEMNNPSKAAVVAKVRRRYGRDFDALFGKGSLDDPENGFATIGQAIGAYERSDVFAPYSSRYDRYRAGTATLDEHETRGLAVFEDPARGNCASCHPAPLFTTFGYAKLDVPVYRDNPFYLMPPALNPDGESYVDHGLAGTTGNPAHEGMYRVPSLRNVGRTTPYGHDGYFRRLDEMIAHHAAHDPTIHLTSQDVSDIDAFLKTLTDANVEGAR